MHTPGSLCVRVHVCVCVCVCVPVCSCVWELQYPPSCCLWEGVQSDGRYGKRWASDDIALCSPPLDMARSILDLSIMRLYMLPIPFVAGCPLYMCYSHQCFIHMVHVMLILVKSECTLSYPLHTNSVCLCV